MEQIIDGRSYDTDKAKLVASDRYWDGSNYERDGRNKYLYKTLKGNFFLHYTTLWQEERDLLEAISKDQAKQYFEDLPEHELEYELAFGEKPVEA